MGGSWEAARKHFGGLRRFRIGFWESWGAEAGSGDEETTSHAQIQKPGATAVNLFRDA